MSSAGMPSCADRLIRSTAFSPVNPETIYSYASAGSEYIGGRSCVCDPNS